ncbi:WIBG Mago-binding [Arabidopsis thaliana x Arabidopsis arenosa]|uniref:WIBG Mago-binding n=1 Tax=Arabidopsis thaliana x Arabidopsis arenosa TaxID=1240361 RepID=A0A8T2BXH7_9BRAS|nr:WIBG Mago-binding [Arabidopsis thaliana x Arabidopsis arenosa]
MGSSNKSGEQGKQMAELSKNLKEGERILEPTRRPDGTLRKPIRIRAGYVPQDEVVKYQSKGSLMKKEMASQGPPGYEPDPAPKPKTKSAKRNERKKEKRLQSTAEKGNSSEDGSASNGSQSVNVLASEMEALDVSSSNDVCGEAPNPVTTGEDVEKRIRALKKKIRLTEAQQQKTASRDLNLEQLEKFSKLEEWRQELKALEDKEA